MQGKFAKICFILLAVILLSPIVNAQNADKKWGVGVYFNFNDYKGDIADDFWDFGNTEPYIGSVTLGRYLNSSFDAVVRLSYFNIESDGAIGNFDDWMFNSNLNFKYKLNNGYIFNEDAIISPFLVGGVGYTHMKAEGMSFEHSFDKKYDDVNLYYAAGLNIRISSSLSLALETGIYYPLNDNYDGYKNKTTGSELYHDKFMHNTIGVVYSFGKSDDSDGDGVGDRKDECPNTPSGVAVDKNGCPLDSDGDGVADYLDECPMLAGDSMLNGCPDTDGDGVADKDDKCPDVKGLVRFAGCPDTDGDGVQDSEDKCPKIKGLAELNGCPDSDGDGVTDLADKCPNTKPGYKVDAMGCAFDNDKDGVVNEEDKCPDVAGPASNYGCPEVKAEVKKELEFAAKNVQFASGKDVLTPKSRQILDEVVQILNDYPAYSLTISGYTDSQGNDDMNLALSEQRANATKKFLTDKGIAAKRILAKGFGEANPVATNATAAGRALNRRVQFELVIK
ncbi:OmpA family protein [Labilibaculum sp.]|uniref:OmpA family protein n=1 Tax=Labilibaculum sp. TaxID=2060723 RepID=UPI00356244DF